ncbi:hypothetical protein [Rhodopseudomonas faecalis]|uniref:hypothetical protein n=1 Tax=Rhodopseudomonas faecalis TaxID=99655 RepID=UPI0011B537F5|nr:hypothetical protein [Rhodopseudomonas faecalis]
MQISTFPIQASRKAIQHSRLSIHEPELALQIQRRLSTAALKALSNANEGSSGIAAISALLPQPHIDLRLRQPENRRKHTV